MAYRSKYTGHEIDEAIGRVLNGGVIGPKGTYSPTAQYERLDIVQYEGASYLVLRPVQGVTPTDGEDYMLLASPGLPAGGAKGQFLAKKSAANNDVEWVGPPEGGGFVETEVSIPIASRTPNTLYGLILETY